MDQILENIRELFASNISTSKIESYTGITSQNINKYRRGETDIARMSLANAKKINDYYLFLEKDKTFKKNDLDRLDSIFAYDSLENKVKMLLITRIVDQRAYQPELQGFHLGYNSNSGFIYTQIHSGVGSGHPVFEFTENQFYVIPTRSYVSQTAGMIIERVDVSDIAPIPKWFLFKRYIDDIDNINASIKQINRVENFTLEYFNTQYDRIK